MSYECIDQGTRCVPWSGMDCKVLGFVDNDQVCILVDHREGDCLRSRRCRFGCRHVDYVDVSDLHSVPKFSDGDAVSCNFVRTNERLQSRATEVGQTTCEQPIEAIACLVCANIDGQAFMCVLRVQGVHVVCIRRVPTALPAVLGSPIDKGQPAPFV
jgi:hypothetical protein